MTSPSQGELSDIPSIPWRPPSMIGRIAARLVFSDRACGMINSKRTAAAWAGQNLDPQWHDLFDRAWAGRPDPARSVRTPADPGDFARTLEFVRYVTAEAERYAAAHGLTLA